MAHWSTFDESTILSKRLLQDPAESTRCTAVTRRAHRWGQGAARPPALCGGGASRAGAPDRTGRRRGAASHRHRHICGPTALEAHLSFYRTIQSLFSYGPRGSRFRRAHPSETRNRRCWLLKLVKHTCVSAYLCNATQK